MQLTRAGFLLLMLTTTVGCGTTHSSFDLAIADSGIGFGNSRHLNGLRFNFIDQEVESVNGLNVTFWDPRQNPDFTLRGIALGLARTDANHVQGLSLAPVAGGHRLYGLNLGLLAAWSPGVMRGLNLGSIIAWAGEEMTGLNIGLMIAGGDLIRGLTASALTISPRPLTDLFEQPNGHLSGINLCGVVIDYARISGLTVSGIVRARQLSGLSCAYFMNDVRGRAEGLNIAPFNFARDLNGVQIGLLNQVAENPHPFRWLPLINVRLSDDAAAEDDTSADPLE